MSDMMTSLFILISILTLLFSMGVVTEASLPHKAVYGGLIAFCLLLLAFLAVRG